MSLFPSRGGWYVAVLVLGAVLHLAALTRLPPGLHSDEAFHQLRALDIVNGVDWPRYITGNNGNEPLMAYLSAGVILLVGPVPWASRLVSAFASLIVLAATLRIGQEVAPGRWVALAASLTWCTLSWALTVGRLGTQPMLAVMGAALAMAGLFAGLRSGRKRDFALAGLGLGLGLDAYVAFRLFPLVAALTWVAAWWRASATQRASLLRGAQVMLGVALVVYAPVASFFLQYPDWFLNRFGQTTGATLGSGTVFATVGNGLWRSIGGLFWLGDENVRHHLPGRPGLDVAQSVLFLIGLGAGLRRQPAATVIGLWSWLGVALLPGALTDSAPHFLRLAPITPALAIVIGLGADWLLTWPRASTQRTGGVLSVGWLLSSAMAVWLVFTQWTSGYAANYLFDQPPRWIAEQLRQAPAGTRLYLSPIPRDHYTIEYVLGPDRFGHLASYNGRECTVVPEQTTALPPWVAVYTGEDQFTPDALRRAYPGLAIMAENVWTGTAQATVYRLPAHAFAQDPIERPMQRTFGGQLEFLGWEAVSGLRAVPGTILHINTHWRLSTPTTSAWVGYVHLRGTPKADGSIIYAQRDSEPCDESYSTWQWRADERVIERTRIDLPPDLPSGTYSLIVGWYDRQTLARLAVTTPSGASVGDEIELTTLRVP